MKNSNRIETIEVNSEAGSDQVGLFTPDVTMIILTWVTFFSLLAILHKFAWKPILKMLDDREEKIRMSLENANQIKDELVGINVKKDVIILEAEEQAKEILAQSRKAAQEVAKIIEHKAQEEARVILKNAQKDMKEEIEKIQVILRKDSENIILELAGKLVEKNLDDEKNHQIINRLIKQI